jgi:hypothetical protein
VDVGVRNEERRSNASIAVMGTGLGTGLRDIYRLRSNSIG